MGSTRGAGVARDVVSSLLAVRPAIDTSAEPLLIFLHIPKTGGTTLSTIIRRQYDERDVYRVTKVADAPYSRRLEDLPQLIPKQTRIVLGHMEFGLHDVLRRQASYVTLLRDPVERVLSHYSMILARPHHPFHTALVSEAVTLEQYASGDRFTAADNLQTRLLSGWGMRPERCPESALEVARRNLSEHFPVVGLAERFEETVILLKRTFRWGFVLYAKENLATNRPRRESLDDATLRAVERSNRLDLELYRHAEKTLDETVATQRFDFEIELEAFKRVNETYGRRHNARTIVE